MSESNPLVDIAFEVPFARIRPEHVKEAAEHLLTQTRGRLKAIANHAGPRTYDNTLGALDAATDELDVAVTVVGHLESVVSTPELRAVYNEIKPEVSAFYASIALDEALYTALKDYAQTEDAKGLTGPRKRYLIKTLDDFRRNGAELDPPGKARLEAISRELAEVTAKFSQNLLDETAAYELVLTDESELAGLPESAKEAAKQSAQSKDLEGWRFTLQAPSYIPVMMHLNDRKVRETMYRAYNTRATSEEKNNPPLILEILKLRKEQASLLGYDNFGDLVLEDRMAQTAVAARDFVRDLEAKTRVAFERETADLVAFARKQSGDANLELKPWDVSYWAEKLRQANYDFDDEVLRPYFPLPQVMNGLFQTAQRLYGVTITKNDKIQAWREEVGKYDIRSHQGEYLGAFYVDTFPREEKRGGAWMNALVSGVLKEDGLSPHLGLICSNITPPVGDKPALLTHEEVQTLFHEFGHLLHQLLSRVEVRNLAGTNVAWDFVELPSQIMENWCWEREALDTFARHYETGEVIPAALFSKMNAARTFRAASAMMRQLGFASTDLALHLDYDPSRDQDVVTYAKSIMDRYSPVSFFEGYAFIAGFGHLFSSAVGYASGYYSYKWAEVLDADAFTRFKDEGVFSETVGAAFRDHILSKGDGEDPMALYTAFMGRPPSLDALLKRSGLHTA